MNTFGKKKAIHIKQILFKKKETIHNKNVT